MEQLLTSLRQPDEWANDLLIEMTPGFLNVNINLISLDCNSDFGHFLNDKVETIKLLLLVLLCKFTLCLCCSKQFKNVEMPLCHAAACSSMYK